MIQMLVHHSRPLPRGHRSEKAVRILRASLGPPVAKRSISSRSRCRSTTKSVHPLLRSLVRRHTTAKRLLVQKSRFHEPPNHTPNQTSWQDVLSPPSPPSIWSNAPAPVQDSLCPHSRSLSGLSCTIRSFTSSTAVVQRDFSMRDVTPFFGYSSSVAVLLNGRSIPVIGLFPVLMRHSGSPSMV